MKLLVTDIDDTLSVGERVSEEVQDACARLKDAGWDIMIATGRTFATAVGHMRAAGATQPAILYDGSRTMSLQGEDLRSFCLEPETARSVLDFVWPLPVEIQISGDEVVHCRESDTETIRFYRRAGVPVYCVDTPQAGTPIYRIGLWVRPEELERLESELNAAFGDALEVTPGGTEFLDLLPRGVSKGTSLERFVSSLPEAPEVLVAAGDHKNDLAMLRYADVAVVPTNAAPSLLDVADIVMPRASEHGMRALVDHLLSPDFKPRKTRPPLRL